MVLGLVECECEKTFYLMDKVGTGQYFKGQSVIFIGFILQKKEKRKIYNK